MAPKLEQFDNISVRENDYRIRCAILGCGMVCVCGIVLSRLEIPTLLVLTALFVYCTDGSRTHFLYYGLYQRCEN